MRCTAFAFVVPVLLSGAARAEQAAPVPPVDTTRRDAGAALAAGGALLGSVGAGMYVITRPSGDPPCACASNSWIFPTVLMGLGGAMLVVGVPLWITGQRGMASAKPRAELRLGPFGGSARLLF
jgi:hypothetical protein